MSVHLILRLLSHEGMHRPREGQGHSSFLFIMPTAPETRHPSLHHTGGHECALECAACPAVRLITKQLSVLFHSLYLILSKFIKYSFLI